MGSTHMTVELPLGPCRVPFVFCLAGDWLSIELEVIAGGGPAQHLFAILWRYAWLPHEHRLRS
eukprot:14144958-Alexandrium_andersonii.AAC.1